MNRHRVGVALQADRVRNLLDRGGDFPDALVGVLRDFVFARGNRAACVKLMVSPRTPMLICSFPFLISSANSFDRTWSDGNSSATCVRGLWRSLFLHRTSRAFALRIALALVAHRAAENYLYGFFDGLPSGRSGEHHHKEREQ